MNRTDRQGILATVLSARAICRAAVTVILLFQVCRLAAAQPLKPQVDPQGKQRTEREVRALNFRCAALEVEATNALLRRHDVKEARAAHQKAYELITLHFGPLHHQSTHRLAIVRAMDKMAELDRPQQLKSIEGIQTLIEAATANIAARQLRRPRKTLAETKESYRESDAALRKSRSIYSRAEKQIVATLGRNCSFMALLYFDRGNIDMELGDYHAAVVSYSAAAAVSKTVYGKSHPVCVRDLCGLGWANMKLGKFKEARKHLMIAEQACRKSLPEENTIRRLVICDLALCWLNSKNDFPKGREIARKFLASSQKSQQVPSGTSETLEDIACLEAIVTFLVTSRCQRQAEFASNLLLKGLLKAKGAVPKQKLIQCYQQRSTLLYQLGYWEKSKAAEAELSRLNSSKSPQ